MSKVSVLVVDDAPFIRDLVRKSLRNHFPGIHIEEAVNGRKAQQMLGKQDFDLILCDWNMPTKSGLDVHNAMRAAERYQHAIFMLVTAVAEASQIRSAIEEGVDDYVKNYLLPSKGY